MNRGTLLENHVKRIFSLAGFSVQTRIRLCGYEVDVYAKRDNISIVIECKQYEKSGINLPNLIYTWVGKNQKIGASKVLLVIYGYKVPKTHLKLAKEEGVRIWTEKDLEKLFDLSISDATKAYQSILADLDIKSDSAVMQWKPDIKLIESLYAYWKSENYSEMESDDENFMVMALAGNSQFIYSPKIKKFSYGLKLFSGTESEFWVVRRESEKKKIPAISSDPMIKLKSFLDTVYEKYGERIDTLIFPHEDIYEKHVQFAKENDIKCVVGDAITSPSLEKHGVLLLSLHNPRILSYGDEPVKPTKVGLEKTRKVKYEKKKDSKSVEHEIDFTEHMKLFEAKPKNKKSKIQLRGYLYRKLKSWRPSKTR